MRLTAAAPPRQWLVEPDARRRRERAARWAAQTGHTVQRVDLRQLAGKYIGETEKNLARLFAQAEQEQWLLFFDEADALFGKRSEVKDAHDRFAHVERSLRRHLAAATVPVLFASRRKQNIDEPFLRRLHFVLMPASLPSARG